MLSGLQVGILVTEANVVLIGLPVCHSALAGDQLCAFAPRCQLAIARCHEDYPPMQTVTPDHAAACWRATETAGVP